jgi:hypothetical protein
VATYLRQEVEQYTKSITMEIDFNLFSDRQIKNIVKQVRNGCVSQGKTMPSAVARWLIKKYPMPHFSFGRWYSSWKGIPDGHTFFETLKNVASVAKISSDSYDIRHIETDIVNANNQTTSTDIRMYTYDKETVKVLKKAMQINTVIEGELKEFLDKLENKTLGVVAVKFQEFADSY